jgi:muramidase (phage lysozyme)
MSDTREGREHGRNAYDLAQGLLDTLNESSLALGDVKVGGKEPPANENTPTGEPGVDTKPTMPQPQPPRFPPTMPTKVGIPLGVLKELIKSAESSEFGGYDALAWHPNYQANAMDRPRDANGFPMWEGSAATGRGSHGAGAYQFEPGLWQEFAPKLGITDFSPESQDRVAEAAIMRYGIFPWKTDVKLLEAIKQYKKNGAMPKNLVTADARQLAYNK